MGFHAYKSVAPLKRHRKVARAPAAARFPRLQKRGPIEAKPKLLGWGVELRFHAYKSVAPLKQDQVRRQSRGFRVSTLTKAWPH